MTNNPEARLSVREAFDEAEAELALSEESAEADTSADSEEESTDQEQLTVETPQEKGLFDDFDADPNSEGEHSDEELYDVTVQGETLQVSLDEALSGYMRQEDYTRKTQELKELQREAEKAMALTRMLKERPTETLRQLYQRINSGQPLDFVQDESAPEVKQTQTPDIEALVEQRVQEVLANDPRLASFQQEQALREVNTIFSKIEKDYGVELTEADKTRVLDEAVKRNTDDLEFVFGAMYSAKLKKEREREAAKQSAKRGSSVEGFSGNASGPSTPQNQAPKRYDSFKSALLEELALMEQGS